MNFGKFLSIALLLLIASCSSDKDTVSIEADDPEMLEAFSKARERLPEFWSVKESPKQGESDFALKVKIEDGDNVEYFWLVNVAREDGRMYGEIGNDPETVKNVKIGDRIEAKPERVVDWLYLKDGKMVGNFTLRPLLKRMPEAEAKVYRAKLAEP